METERKHCPTPETHSKPDELRSYQLTTSTQQCDFESDENTAVLVQSGIDTVVAMKSNSISRTNSNSWENLEALAAPDTLVQNDNYGKLLEFIDNLVHNLSPVEPTTTTTACGMERSNSWEFQSFSSKYSSRPQDRSCGDRDGGVSCLGNGCEQFYTFPRTKRRSSWTRERRQSSDEVEPFVWEGFPDVGWHTRRRFDDDVFRSSSSCGSSECCEK